MQGASTTLCFCAGTVRQGGSMMPSDEVHLASLSHFASLCACKKISCGASMVQHPILLHSL